MTMLVRLATAVLSLLIFLATPLAAAPTYDIHDVLLEAATQGVEDELAAAELSGRLLSFGPSVIPELLDGAAVGVKLDDGSWRPLTPLARAAVVEALGLMPREAVHRVLLQLTGGPASEQVRLSSMDVLGTIGSAADIRLLLVTVQGGATDDLIPRQLRASFANALQRIAGRDPESPSSIRREISNARPELLADLVAGLACTSNRRARREMTETLGLRPEADALLFRAINDLVVDQGRPADETLERATLSGLSSPNLQARVQAARLAQSLDLVAAVPDLLRCASGDDQLAARAASQALCRILRIPLPARGSAWTDWSKDEQDWWQGRGSVLFAGLQSGDPAKVAYGIRELSNARLHREEIVPLIEETALVGNPSARSQALRALGSLGGLEAENILLRVISDPDLKPELLAACTKALVSCTGLELGDSPSVWQTVIEIRRR